MCKELKNLASKMGNAVESFLNSPGFSSVGAFVTAHTSHTIIYIPGGINHGILIPWQKETIESSSEEEGYELLVLGVAPDN